MFDGRHGRKSMVIRSLFGGKMTPSTAKLFWDRLEMATPTAALLYTFQCVYLMLLAMYRELLEEYLHSSQLRLNSASFPASSTLERRPAQNQNIDRYCEATDCGTVKCKASMNVIATVVGGV